MLVLRYFPLSLFRHHALRFLAVPVDRLHLFHPRPPPLAQRNPSDLSSLTAASPPDSCASSAATTTKLEISGLRSSDSLDASSIQVYHRHPLKTTPSNSTISTRPSRFTTGKSPTFLKDYFIGNMAMVPKPQTFNKAFAHPGWHSAMEQEMESISWNET